MTLPDGYLARPAEAGDLDLVEGIFRDYDLADAGRADPMRVYLEWVWGMGSTDLARDTRLVLASDGSPAAYAEVWGRSTHVSRDATVIVHPAHRRRGLGSMLVAWTEERACEVRRTGGRLERLLNGVSATDDDAHAILEAAGYRWVRRTYDMERTLAADEAPGEAPTGVRVRAFADGDERALHDVLQRSFEGHFGWEPTPFEEWRDGMVDAPTWDPSLAFLAEADGRAVGAIVALAADERSGYVAQVGVLASHRGRGIAKALLRRSFAELARRGCTEVQLSVDAENATGATVLYERVGMSVRREFHLFEKVLAD